MKKTTALFLVALLSLSIASAATVIPLSPAAPDLQNGIFSVSFDARAISDKAIPVTIYDFVLYDAAAVEALQPGDVIVYDDEKITVETVEKKDGFVDINNRSSEEYTGGGLSLLRIGESGTPYRTFEENDDGLMTDVLTVELPLADEVTYKHFAFDLWQRLREDYDSATVPAEYLKDTIVEAILRFDGINDVIDFNDLTASDESDSMDDEYLYYLFSGDMSTLRLKDGKVVEIVVDYHP